MSLRKILLTAAATAVVAYAAGFYTAKRAEQDLRQYAEQRLLRLVYETDFLTDVKTVKAYTAMLHRIRSGKLTEADILVL